MEIRIHKTGVSKSGKKWICAKCHWNDRNGLGHNEYFFIKPWNQETFEQCLIEQQVVSEQIKAIYGENNR